MIPCLSRNEARSVGQRSLCSVDCQGHQATPCTLELIGEKTNEEVVLRFQ